MSLIDKLGSSGLKINESNERKIDNEIKYLGYLKMTELLKQSNDISNIINIYKYDCKLSSFFWKHIRRVETNFKALLINYFFEKGDPIYVDSETEADNYVDSEIEANNYVDSEIEANNYVDSETEADNYVDSEIEANNYVDSETEADNYVDSKVETNNKKNKTKKVNKNFALKYLLYSDDDSIRDKKTYRISKDIIVNSHLKKKSSKNIINIITNMSLGKILDFFNTLDPEKIIIFDEIVKYRKLSELVVIRNRIAHHKLLSNKFNKDDFEDFWNTIKSLSVKTEKTKKNDKEIEYLLKNMYN